MYINNCPTRCNTKQSIYYSASSLYMFWVPTTPIIRSTQNFNYSLRYWSYFCAATLQRDQGCQPHPSSGVHKTVTTASSTGHIFVQLPPPTWPRVSTTPIIRSTQNCNYSLQYWSYFCAATPPTWPRVSTTPIIRSTQHCNYSLQYWSYFCAATPSNVTKSFNYTHHQEYTKL